MVAREALGRPGSAVASKYLLTGLAVCGQCRGTLYAQSRSHGRQRAHFYACTSYFYRGAAVCANNLVVPMAQADDGVLGAFEDQLLNPTVIAHGIREAFAALQHPPDTAQADALGRELAEVDAQLGRLVDAIALGDEIPVLIARMNTLERQRIALAGRLEAFGRVATVTAGDLHAFEREIQARLGDWRRLLRQHPQQARQMLTKLVSARMTFTPHVEGEQRWYDFATDCTLGNVIGGALHLTRWWPQRDSNPCFSLERAVS